MRTFLFLLLLLIPSVGQAATNVAWSGGTQHAPFITPQITGNDALDLLAGAIADTLTMQASDTTNAILVWDCNNLTAFVAGAGADSVTMTVQHSLDKTNWLTFTTGNTAIANQNLGTYAAIRNVLATNALSTGTAYTGSTPSKWVRVIVKNNCDATQDASGNTLINISAGIVGMCTR